MRSINIIFIPILICLVTLFVKSIYHELEYDSLKVLYENIDWNRLSGADVRKYDILQVRTNSECILYFRYGIMQ